MKKFLLLVLSLLLFPAITQAETYYGVPWGADDLNNITVGKWEGRTTTYRFKAEHTGTTEDFTFYVINKTPDYAEGDGGHILIELKTDDNGLPSDTVLDSYLWYPPMLDFYDPNNDKFPTLPLSADLVEGETYHIQFSNIHPDPVNNYVSVDNLFVWDEEISPMHPAISQDELAVLIMGYYGNWNWEVLENQTPIYKLSYTDGNSQGQPYIDGKTSYFKNMDGTNMVRQTFTNNDQDRLVSDVNVRVKKISGGGDLTVRLEHYNGDVISEGTIPEAEISTTISWLNYTLSEPINLEEGRPYNLVLSSNGGQYTTNPIQQGNYYGLDAGGFDDGVMYYSSNAGSSWTSFPFDGDMQFYFTVEEEAVVEETYDVVVVQTSSSGVQHIEDILDDNYNIIEMTIDEVKAGVPAEAEVLVFPGSADFADHIVISYPPYLNTDLRNSLRNFVNNGGGFVGICGGSNVGAAIMQTEYYNMAFNVTMANLLPATAVQYISWMEAYQGGGSLDNVSPDVLNFSSHVIAGDYANGIHDVDYYGGPVFENTNSLDVIATYTEQIQDPEYNNIGKAAILAGDSGQGKVVLSASHPEYNANTHFLLENMVAWVNNELVENPIVDIDGDGVPEEDDCNDNDPNISQDQTYYADNDSDGLGDPNNTTSVCALTVPTGYVTNNSDLNDNDADNDGVETENDCNDQDPNLQNNITVYLDNDGDGYGVGTATQVCALTPPTGYVLNNNDCDDNEAGIFENQTFYQDADGDGLGNPAVTLEACVLSLEGYVANSNDQNDQDADNDGKPTNLDCNDNDPSISENQLYFADNDGDGYGDINIPVYECSYTPSPGNVTNNNDCDDTNANIYEGQTFYADNDQDGLGD
ncbi:MAG: BPL-N domain-containing protein, partial [Patescibacteria group bacterium]